MKVRVLKNMPFAKVGNLYALGEDKRFHFNAYPVTARVSLREAKIMIEDGWLEEEKEMNLVGKLYNFHMRGIKTKSIMHECQEVAKIARDHALECLDNVVKKNATRLQVYPITISEIRKALEEM